MHQESYHENESYSQFLENWDPRFYARYADALAQAGHRILDVGCGVGQVLDRWVKAGKEAHGVDVSKPSVDRAKKISPHAQVYDGKVLPFADRYFDAAGALNVLEHVEEPEAFIPELVRVVKPGGRVLISSPNFFRVFGFRDYHAHMRGVGQKWRNWRRIAAKKEGMKRSPDQVRFDRMTPIVREPFQPDDDAIIATNPWEISFFLERAGCVIEQVLCTDRYVSQPLDWILNASPARHYMFNAFVVARRTIT